MERFERGLVLFEEGVMNKIPRYARDGQAGFLVTLGMTKGEDFGTPAEDFSHTLSQVHSHAFGTGGSKQDSKRQFNQSESPL